MMTDVKFTHGSELILFAIDLDPEMTTEDARGRTRLEVVKHAIMAFVQAKKRLSAQHKFGLITLDQQEAVLHPDSITSSIDDFTDCLLQLQPEDQPQFISSGSGNSTVFDMGSLITAVAPLLQQQQQQQCSVEHIAGGILSPSPTLLSSSSSKSSSSSSRISQRQQQDQQQQLRVILIYGRSHLPPPTLASNSDQGLVLDCIYLHDKPQAGLNNPQEVYSALEELVDSMTLRVGHAGFVYETTAGRSLKLMSCMAMLLTHPAQRQAQVDTKPPLDFATAPLMHLPSDAANAATGVPIVSPERLPSVSATSAWSKPLTTTNTTSNVEYNTPHNNSSSGGGGAWGSLPAAGASSSSGREGAWAATAAGSSAAAASTPWSDPWDDSSSSAAFGGGDLLLLGQAPTSVNSFRQSAAATAPSLLSSAAAAGGSSSSGATTSSSSKQIPATELVATGIPAGVVSGIPDGQPSYSLDDTVAMGFAMPGQGLDGLQNLYIGHHDNTSKAQGGAGSSSSSTAAAAAGASPLG